MQLIYSVIPNALPSVHKSKLANLIRSSFPRKQLECDIEFINRYDLGVVAQKAGKFVSFMSLSHHKDEWYDLENFCVGREHRERGLGSEMLRFLQTDFPKNTKFRLYVDHTGIEGRLIEFYTRNGFKVVVSNDSETCMEMVVS